MCPPLTSQHLAAGLYGEKVWPFPMVLHVQTQQVNEENNMELAVGINAVQTHWVAFFQKPTSLVIFGRELKLGDLLNAALYFSSAG